MCSRRRPWSAAVTVVIADIADSAVMGGSTDVTTVTGMTTVF